MTLHGQADSLHYNQRVHPWSRTAVSIQGMVVDWGQDTRLVAEEGCVMAIRAPVEIDYSTFPEDDGEPMAETLAHAVQMVDLQWTLQTLFDRQGRSATTAVGGNQLMYYNPRDGRDHVSPDVYVILDRRPPAPPSWKTWIEGKFPDIVFEISSPSTVDEDVGPKRALYARLQVREYYIYDPQQETTPAFRGYERRGDRLEPLPLLMSGGISSPLLNTELRPMAMPETRRRPAGVWLRVLDPATGRPIEIAEEEHDAYQAAVEQLTATAEQLTVTAEQLTATSEQLTVTAEQLATARERLAAEEQARVAADERAARAEALLRALLDDQARTRDAGASDQGDQ